MQSPTPIYFTKPFDDDLIPIDVSAKKYIEITQNESTFELLLSYIAKNALNIEKTSFYGSKEENVAPLSFRFHPIQGQDKDIPGYKKAIEDGLRVGLGWFKFYDNEGNLLYGLHQAIGLPVGTSCGPQQHETLILFTDKDEKQLAQFITYLIDLSQVVNEASFSTFKWNARSLNWRSQVVCRARSLDSVILPEIIKNKLVNDIKQFLSPATKDFYHLHGIPYRRSYLFYGVPGSGKTSLVQALAGHFRRSISILQPATPEITDDSLQEAICRIPKNTICIIEDVDALFAKDRSRKTDTKITFSGLLNALDGVGSTHGQIFILSTNLRDQLDPALIRKGRVDLHIEFTFATIEQIRKMWIAFYPMAESLADTFVNKLLQSLGGKQIVTAQLQHFFVMHMHDTAEEALDNVYDIVEDIIQNDIEMNDPSNFEVIKVNESK